MTQPVSVNPERLQVKLIEITEYSDEVLVNVQHLLEQHTTNRSAFLKYTLCTILNSTSTHLFFLVPENCNPKEKLEVWGMVTVNICLTCSSPRAWVDDFVIDEKYRRLGLAHTMMDQVLKFAHYLGVPSVMLTSSPVRIAGNQFCKTFGFENFDTNVYIYRLPIGNKGV